MCINGDLLRGFLPVVWSVQRSAAQPAPRGADTQGLDVLQAAQIENTATARAPLGHRQVRNGQKALPCHPDEELGDIVLLGSRELILELLAHVHTQGWALWMMFPSLLVPLMVVICSWAVKGAHVGKQQEREDGQDLQQWLSSHHTLGERTS